MHVLSCKESEAIVAQSLKCIHDAHRDSLFIWRTVGGRGRLALTVLCLRARVSHDRQYGQTIQRDWLKDAFTESMKQTINDQGWEAELEKTKYDWKLKLVR